MSLDNVLNTVVERERENNLIFDAHVVRVNGR